MLREYALVADGERGALVGPRGDVVWWCVPRWDDDAVLSSLIGGDGVYGVTPRDRFVWGGSYEPGSLIWRSRWVTMNAGVVQCREALALPADPHTAVLLRRVEAGPEPARVAVVLDLRAGFGRQPMTDLRRHPDGTWTACTGGLHLRWSGGAEARVDDAGRLAMDLTLPAGSHHDLVLEVGDRPLGAVVAAGTAWERTERAWREAAPGLTHSVAPRDARQSWAVLHGLTGRDGGMVAAATMSLPERAERHRNYDYRYVWVRDQCYAGLAAAAAGLEELFDTAVGFVTARLLADGDRLRPAYRGDGSAVPQERDLHLPGYPGGQDVAGNWVNQQFQLDAVGEVLQLLARAAALDRLDRDGRRAMRLGVDVVARAWLRPDAGIWELHDHWWTQSRLAAVAGLHAVAGQLTAREAGPVLDLAETVLAETTTRCLDPSGHWRRSPTHPGVDASLLLPPLRGAPAADDPRTLATVEQVRRELVREGYVYRFRAGDQPLGEEEGAFLLCGFLMAMAERQQGNEVAAFRWFERTRAACGSPGLFAEEYDVEQRQLRGNLPQAFVHALMLETAVTL
ncbi:glycoside hydrolase family 15 protein [Oryzihumus sp.]|uniref:glycoside hydrolase family 15 protein n=1 Tax=Oryzihumus sp. TaxID=1968903 RepID=UPI002ED774C5